MTALTLRASGPLPLAETWERYARPALWPTWAPQISSVSASAARLEAGVTGRVHGPFRVSIDFVVDTWDDAQHRWSWTVRRGPLRLRLEHGADPQATGGSSTWLRLHGPLPIIAAYAPLARFALHRLVH